MIKNFSGKSTDKFTSIYPFLESYLRKGDRYETNVQWTFITYSKPSLQSVEAAKSKKWHIRGLFGDVDLATRIPKNWSYKSVIF